MSSGIQIINEMRAEANEAQAQHLMRFFRAGKHGARRQLFQFLDLHASEMPRTMLRYSIEQFNPEEREHYMNLPR